MSNSDSKPSKKSKILFQLSGSIACFKACAVLSKLAQAGHEIEVVATPSALKFVGEATLEGLTGRKVHTSTFESGRYMDHIHLVRWADMILLCPATANTLNKLAAGVGDDLISTMFLAHDFKKPYLVAPAMNQFMWTHPATQASVTKLISWGVNILGTSAGALACGEIGEGRMLEPDQILEAVDTALGAARHTTKDGVNQAISPAKRILITSGGTTEPIDGVRAITNTSSGRTGAEIASWFANSGAEVTLLHAKSAVLPREFNGTLRAFTSFETLKTALTQELAAKSFDVVIHLAAVADYSVSRVESNGAVYQAPLKQKIDSGEDLKITLKKNPKLVDMIRSLSMNKEVQVVAFKLTATADEPTRLAAVKALNAHAKPDFVVQNEASQITATSHPFRIFRSNRLIREVDGAIDLARSLSELMFKSDELESSRSVTGREQSPGGSL